MPNPTHLSPDVAIVGGGVAGSALAITLRRQGLDVVLIERSERFKDRIRGETIHPWGTNELRTLDLYDLAIDQARAQPQVFWQKFQDREAQLPYRWSDEFPDTPGGLGVSHVVLQNALFEEAARLGVEIYRPARVALSRNPGGPSLVVTTPTAETVLQPRLIAGADGEHSATRAWTGGAMTPDPGHHHIGGALIRGLGLETDRIYQTYIDGGFVLVSPQSDDTARLYLICATPEAMGIQRSPNPAKRIVERFREGMPEGFVDTAWESLGPVAFFSNASAPVFVPDTADIVIIGDASGRNDPSQGHGLSLAFHDVRILGEMLAGESDWQTIPDRFHKGKQKYFETLRQHALWTERQATETGPGIDELKARIARARELDPTAGGFAAIFATGPEGLNASEAARRDFLGEDLTVDGLVSA